MRNILLVLGLLAVSFTSALGQVSPVQVSYLPSARSGEPNAAVTVFGTFANSSNEEIECAIRSTFLGGLPDGVSGQVRAYPVENGAITGDSIDPIVVPAGGTADFLVSMTVNGEFTGAGRPDFRCVGTTFSAVPPSYTLVNDVYLTIANGPAPDIVMIGDTTSSDGTARVAQTGPRAALMAVSAVNIGDATANLEIVGTIGGFPAMDRALSTRICEIDAAGICQSPEAASVTIANWAANEVRLFAVRARFPDGVGVPFYPGQIRLFAAVRPPAPLGLETALNGEVLDDRSEIARTSAAMDVEIGEAFYQIWDPGEPLPATYGCEFRGNFDYSGGRSGLQNGRLAIWPDGVGGAEGHGWSEINDGRQIYSIDIPDWEQPGGTITLHGSGELGPTSRDESMPISFAHDFANSGVRFTWEGLAGIFSDFGSAGQMRCAGQPGQTTVPFEPQQPFYRLRRRYSVDDFEGDWDGDEVTDPDTSPTYALEVAGMSSTNGGTSFEFSEDNYVRVVERPRTRPDGDIDVGQAFVQFFEMLGGATADPDAPSLGTVFVDGPPDPDSQNPPSCMVFLQIDSGEGPPDEDARLFSLVREGEDQDAAFEICWD